SWPRPKPALEAWCDFLSLKDLRIRRIPPTLAIVPSRPIFRQPNFLDNDAHASLAPPALFLVEYACRLGRAGGLARAAHHCRSRGLAQPRLALGTAGAARWTLDSLAGRSLAGRDYPASRPGLLLRDRAPQPARRPRRPDHLPPHPARRGGLRRLR